MSEPEQSYYEIALTNRQALVAFGVLLAVVVVAFGAGFWVARDPDARPPVADAEPAGQVGQAPLRPEPALEKVARAADPSTTLAEDVSGRAVGRPTATAAEPPATVPELEAEEPEAALALAAEPEPIAAPVTPSEATPPPAAAAPARPAPAPPAASPAPAPGSVVVQVLATGDRLKAEGLVKRLEAAGYAAFLSPAGSGAATTYRVRIGPFANREAALPVQARVDRQFKVESWITAP